MSPPKKKKTRKPTADELRLWRYVVKDAEPISGRRSKADLEGPEPETKLSSPAQERIETDKAPETKKRKIRLGEAPIPVSERNARAKRAPFGKPASGVSSTGGTVHTGIDRRTQQRLRRGQIETEARLDLHGCRQHEAHERLRRFLVQSRAQGMRCVLVITGKGESPYARHTLHSGDYYHVPERAGVLRQLVPQWLGEARFAEHVAGIQPAHPKHGGGGAFYIWLRRKRSTSVKG